MFKKYKTFSMLIYSYINTSGNWKNEKLCGNCVEIPLPKAMAEADHSNLSMMRNLLSILYFLFESTR